VNLLRFLLLPLSVPSWVGCRLSNGMALAVDGAINSMAHAASRIPGHGEAASQTDQQAEVRDQDG
jgi:hypothetical protein